jgi:hypothetical protein
MRNPPVDCLFSLLVGNRLGWADNISNGLTGLFTPAAARGQKLTKRVVFPATRASDITVQFDFPTTAAPAHSWDSDPAVRDRDATVDDFLAIDFTSQTGTVVVLGRFIVTDDISIFIHFEDAASARFIFIVKQVIPDGVGDVAGMLDDIHGLSSEN